MRRGISCKTGRLLTWQEGTRVRLCAQSPVRRANSQKEEQRCGHPPPGDQPQKLAGDRPKHRRAPTPQLDRPPLYFLTLSGSSVCTLPLRVTCPRSLTQLVVRRNSSGISTLRRRSQAGLPQVCLTLCRRSLLITRKTCVERGGGLMLTSCCA